MCGRYSITIDKRTIEHRFNARSHFSDPKAVGAERFDLAALYRRQGRYSESEPLFRSTLLVTQKMRGAEHEDTAVCMAELAGMLGETGRLQEAIPLCDLAHDNLLRLLGKGHTKTAATGEERALMYRMSGELSEAEAIFKRTLSLWETSNDRSRLARTCARLATLQVLNSDPEGALGFAHRAIAIQEAVLSPDHPELAHTRATLALSKEGLGLDDQALMHIRASVATLEVQVADGQPWLREARITVARLAAKARA
jgi:tetratricopeptide (TPR) repeat protein